MKLTLHGAVGAICVGNALLVALLAAGCDSNTEDGAPGSVSRSEAMRAEASAIQEIQAVFRRETGHTLRMFRPRNVIPEFGDFVSMHPDDFLKRLFGDFTIFVELSPGTASTPKRRRKEYVVWQENPPELGNPGYWVAEKWYGNVRLAWFNPVRKLDTRWRRLDRILSTVFAR